MGPEKTRYLEELKTGIKAAEKAGEIIDSYQTAEEKNKKRKLDGSIVTAADKESQRTIVQYIRQKFPKDGFLGEEENLTPENQKRVWIIDPLDGTANFSKGIPFYAVSIALEVEGEIVLGIVHLPESSRSETYFGVVKEGAFIKEPGENLESASEIEVTAQKQIEESHFFLTAFDIYEGEIEKEKNLLTQLAQEGGFQRQLGAAAPEMVFLASGKVDFLVNPIAKKWDFAGAKPIIEEAGGEVRVRESCFSNSYEVVASNGKLQQQVERIVGSWFQ